MTTSVTPPAKVQDTPSTRNHPTKFRGVGDNAGRANWVVKLFLGLICFLWLVPVIGLFVTSLRTPEAANTSGWWTFLKSPLDAAQWTLNNYHEVATRNGMGQAFVNSLVVTLPATIIPIMIAAFAAYAFTFMLQHLGDQRGDRRALGAGQRDVREQRVALERLDHRGDAVVPADPQVVALGDVVGEHHPEPAPIRDSTVSSTLRSSDCASSTITNASCSERPRMWVSGSTSSMPRSSDLVDHVRGDQRAEGVEDRLRPGRHLLASLPGR
jgi:hypothetical protein